MYGDRISIFLELGDWGGKEGEKLLRGGGFLEN